MTASETSSAWPPEFGVNEWMLEELYDKFVEDRHSVDREWWPLLEAHADQSKPALSAPHEVATSTAATRTADEPSGSDDDTRVEQIHGAARSLASSMEA